MYHEVFIKIRAGQAHIITNLPPAYNQKNRPPHIIKNDVLHIYKKRYNKNTNFKIDLLHPFFQFLAIFVVRFQFSAKFRSEWRGQTSKIRTFENIDFLIPHTHLC